MELKGKKIAFLGDSITEGFGASSAECRFPDIIARETGAVCLNYGICGTRIARQIHPTEWALSFDNDYCKRADEIDADSDIIVVFGGTNDYGHGDAPFGEFSDRTCATYCGAVHELIVKLINRCPEAELVFITPLHRLGEDEPCAANNRPLVDYVNVIRRTCEYYSVPVIDLYATCRMQPAVETVREKYMPDGLHPSDAGYRILAERIASFLKAL